VRNCVPANWETATLDDLASIIRGVTFPASAKLAAPTDDSVICLRTSNVQKTLEFGDVLHVAESYVKRDEQWLQDGDTVISMANSYELVGKVAYAKSPPPRTTIGGFISIVRSRGIDTRFLHYQLASTDTQEEMRKTASTTVNISNLSLRGIRPLPMVVAPLYEQNRIVEAIESYLTRLDDVLASLEHVQRNLERYRASVLKAAVEGRLVPTEAELARQEGRSYEPASELLKRILAERKSRWIKDAAKKARAKAEAKALKSGKPWTPEDDVSALEKARKAAEAKYKEPEAPGLSALQAQAGTADLPNLPEGWCWTTAEAVSHLVTDGDHNPPKRVPAGIPHLTAKHVKDWRITDAHCSYVSQEGFAKTRARYEPIAGDLIVTCVGTVGEAAIVPDSFVFSADRNLAAIRLAREGATPEFVLLVLSSPAVRRVLAGLSGSTAQPHLYLGDLRKLPIPLPPVEEQVRIVATALECISRIRRQAEEVTRTERSAGALRQSILKWAFEGKLVKQDPNDEPASALLERIRAERFGACR